MKMFVCTHSLGDGSDSVFEKGRQRKKEGRSLQMTVMKNLMKASKCLVSSGKNFLSTFSVNVECYLNSHKGNYKSIKEKMVFDRCIMCISNVASY